MTGTWKQVGMSVYVALDMAHRLQQHRMIAALRTVQVLVTPHAAVLLVSPIDRGCTGQQETELSEVYCPFVLQAGAAKVYAVEASNMANFAQQLAEKNPAGKAIQVRRPTWHSGRCKPVANCVQSLQVHQAVSLPAKPLAPQLQLL